MNQYIIKERHLNLNIGVLPTNHICQHVGMTHQEYRGKAYIY